MKNDITLLIIGYDPYIDVWNHYFTLLNKYWKDRPKTLLATNTATPNYEGVRVVCAGADAEWSRKVQVALKEVDTKYVLLLLEDFYTTRPVDEKKLEGLVSIMEADGIRYCKLLNQSPIRGKKYKGLKYLRVIPPQSEYAISLQPAIWEKSFLAERVGTENYNAWKFEFAQIKDNNCNVGKVDCLADKRNVLEITHAVVQSKYLRSAIKTFKKQGYKIDLSERAQLSRRQNFKYRAKQFFSDYTPRPFKKLFKKIGRLFKMEYVSDRADVK